MAEAFTPPPINPIAFRELQQAIARAAVDRLLAEEVELRSQGKKKRGRPEETAAQLKIERAENYHRIPGTQANP
jgi:hypothetical protein